MLDLASALSGLQETHRESPWSSHEYVKGWGVVGLPFDSGHVLALRVLPESNFVSYRALWHRNPHGEWAVYVDQQKPCACTTYYGAACSRTAYTPLRIEWIGPASVRVTMDRPSVDWTFTASDDWRLRALNAVNSRLPLASWRSRALVRAREEVARALGMGRLQLSGTTPSGHLGTLMPEELYFIEESRAVVDGMDLGRPAHLLDNPLIGTLPLPTRGVLAKAMGMWRIDDPAEYERRLQEAVGFDALA
ncbi:MAG TPA: hypothetical protein VFB69_05765 [Candidatus Dormibacteraeota bacterium]|nr:hypothetical protein [Candidatus Dormibacteraeota bacterium]